MTDMPLHLQMILHLDAEDAHREVAGWFAELRAKYAPAEKKSVLQEYIALAIGAGGSGLMNQSMQNNAYLNPYCYGLNPANATANWWPITLEFSR